MLKRRFRGTKDLWELLTRKKPNLDLITPEDCEKYKSILLVTSGHLEECLDGNGHVSRGPKYRNVISKLFPTNRGQKRGLTFPETLWENTKSGNVAITMAKTKTKYRLLSCLFYKLGRVRAFFTGDKLRSAAMSDQDLAIHLLAQV
jgi:hypothetical protein